MKKPLLLKIGGLTCLFLILLVLIFPAERRAHDTDHRHAEHKNTQESEIFVDLVNPDLEDFDIAKDILLDEMHGAPRKDNALERYNVMCNNYPDICKKTNRQEDYDISEQYMYTLMMLYLITSIDDNILMDTDNTLRQTVQKIDIYEHSKDRRGSASATSVRINTGKIDNIREFREVWTHEVAGHILDIGTIDYRDPPLHETFTEFGKPTFGLKDWSLKFYSISRLDETTRKKDSSYRDFVSGYAMRNTFEEFAEFSNSWINHHDLLVEMTKTNDKLKQKYDLFSEILGDRYFDGDTDSLRRFTPSERVFDSTKEWKS